MDVDTSAFGSMQIPKISRRRKLINDMLGQKKENYFVRNLEYVCKNIVVTKNHSNWMIFHCVLVIYFLFNAYLLLLFIGVRTIFYQCERWGPRQGIH
jgi:hypothetical protein